MTVSAKLSNLRVSPRKVRLVAGLIRGLKVKDAQKQLMFLNKRSSDPILKLLNSAVANAKNNAKLSEENLVVATIFVDCGAVLKRSRPRAFGRAFAIRKRTSHITLVLEDKSSPKDGVKELKESKKSKKDIKDVVEKKTKASPKKEKAKSKKQSK